MRPTPISASTTVRLPTVQHFTHEDGTPCVRVSLDGLHGDGKFMILDADAWQHVSEEVTPFWQVQKMSGVSYVVSSSMKAVEIARQTSKAGMLFLARYLAQPAAGLNVRFANDDRFDLRRANLVVLDKSGHSRANVALRVARQRARDDAARAAMATVNAAATGAVA